MNETTFQNKDVIKIINSDYIPVRLDADKDLNVIKQFRVINLPTILILDTNHKVIKQLPGYISPEDLIIKLQPVLKSVNKTTSSQLMDKQHITIIGEKKNFLTQDLYKTAQHYARQGIEIEVLEKGAKSNKYPDINFPSLNKPAAFICTQYHCSLPVFNPAELSKMIRGITIPPLALIQKQHTALEASSLKDQLLSNNKINITTKLLNKNSIFSLFGFWILGVLMAFTPCILPLLIIMAGFLGGKAGNITKRNAVYLTITYIMALSITYAIAGIVAASFGFYVQASFQHTWIVVCFSLIFVLLGLSLLGFYKIALPKKWHHILLKNNKYQEHYTYCQVIVMGVLATLIASPCAAAPLLVVLSYVGMTGNVIFGALSLFFIGLGIGTPLLIAISIGSSILPKSHELLEGIKLFFGLTLLGISIWLVNRVVPEWLNMCMWSALVIYTAILMRRLHQNTDTRFWKAWKLLSYLVLAYGMAIFIGAIFGNTNPLNPFQPNEKLETNSFLANSSFTDITNITELERRIYLAKQNHKPVLVVFTATWCQICKEQKKVFLAPELHELLQQFVLLRVNVSDDSTIDLAKKFSIIAPPETIFFDVSGRRVALRLPDDLTVSTLITALKQILNGNS